MTIDVYDFFSGCGGTSFGLKEAGLDIKLALDIDMDSLRSFKSNIPEANILNADIRSVSANKLPIQITNNPFLFCGCAPCQPFSKQYKGDNSTDSRVNLLNEFFRFIEYWCPDFVLVENVPGLQKIDRNGPFASFVTKLEENGYFVDYKIVRASDYGVPQRRTRLILLASKGYKVLIPEPSSEKHSTVKDWIHGFPSLENGQTDPNDYCHQAARLAPINLQRIRATPEGGSMRDWPEELLPNCHRNHNGHKDSYSRLSWNKPASALTTRCLSYSNGRFGHPEQDRAISLREAACLQTFPRDYVFTGNLHSMARQVGNAVPPLMSKRIGIEIMKAYTGGSA